MQGSTPTRFEGGKFCALCRQIFDIHDDIERCPIDSSLLTVIRRTPFDGSPVGQYFQIVELLGCGGWAVVYKAKQLFQNRTVAVKLLHSHLLTRPDLADRFAREAAIVSRLTHPNVISTVDYGALASGVPYLIMEYLPGVNLDELLKKKGRLSFSEVHQILNQVCAGLGAAHESKIVHRDIKPSNIRIANADRQAIIVKVMDFGLAKVIEESGLSANKLTLTGFTIGTPDYMSPEMCKGEQVDQRTDIYSLGCVMYEMLAGQPPIKGTNAFETMQKHLNHVPASFESIGVLVAPAVQSVVMKALAKNPEDRFSSVAEFSDALDRCRSEGEALAGAVTARRNVPPNDPVGAAVFSGLDQLRHWLQALKAAKPTAGNALPADAAVRVEPQGGQSQEPGEDETLALLLEFEDTIVPPSIFEETGPLHSPMVDPVDITQLESTYGAETTSELLNVFISTAERLLELMEDARQKKRAMALHLLARQLKAAASAIGAAEITRLSVSMEVATAQSDFLQIRIVHEGLKLSVKKLAQFIEQRPVAD